ncbi:maleylpyruvate isomerase N-terminal domain-containing protein [Aeromicrobium wangtongii]|uniref:Maleylpyruvate isomerase N-terminal domain-containing protein n=1 Tax=Aeromicrobium wangtongii TaxID=2969247 RepID=A0ABY5M682_9ACTN|nr:maleylpyruvate isomerase N-terminal domain-containing protein [Aeromicrobium wangtongii]MCD9198550.1 maleylpyruvate isomerase N-terminal domain-containing protein [Aeromicrobium wangtongii]UUP12576.1 maleylpyruvate isomerase N-terminal domain-containing protein [Aeromicrobium wangtongii]
MVTSRDLLHRQWTDLRAWIENSGLLDHRTEPSVLEAWNVHELVTHLGRSFLALTVLGPEPGARTETLGSYIAAYSASAQEIADGTIQLARSFESDLLGGIDNCARLGFSTLDALHTDVVRGPRGTIGLDDFVMTRLLELVVHGDDLGRSVPTVPAPPLLDEAVDAVAGALAQAYAEVAGSPPQTGERLTWIRQATGREPSDDAALPLL